jgi:tetratricopeptide (TPR) repeat protein
VSIRSGLVIAVAAIGILGAGWATPAAAQSAACTGNGKISKQIAKPMTAAQEAQRAKKWQDVLTRVHEADAVPGAKSQFDQYYMAEFRGYAYHMLHQEPDAAREFEAALNSPCMPEAKKLERYKTLTGLYSSLKNYPKVIDYGNRALKISRDPDMYVAVAQAYYLSGNNKESVRLMNELLAILEQKGTVPKEQQLLLVVAACQRANDNACVSKVFEKLVVYYPKAEYWQNLLAALKNSDTDDIQKLNVMRLSVYVKVLKKPEDYKEMAQLALETKLACESQSVLEQGFAQKVFVEKRDIDVNTRLLAAAKKEAESDKAALAKNEAAARAAATGDAAIKVGAQYLGCGEPAKAAEVIQFGISKGGIAKGDPKEAELVDEAGLLLGISYLRSNNKAEAAKAFHTVKRDPTMVRIAKLWLLNT